MAELKSYTCSKCGGILTFDSDQEFFDCPFCGNRYDIMDFHSDEVHAQAQSCLNEKDFGAARDKYNLLLEKFPRDFKALRGLVLCDLRITSHDLLSNPDNLKKGNVLSAKRTSQIAEKKAEGKAGDYFVCLTKMIETVSEIKTLEDEKKVVNSKESRSLFDGAKVFVDEKEKHYGRGKLIYGGYAAFYLLIMIFAVFNNEREAWGRGIVVILVMTTLTILGFVADDLIHNYRMSSVRQLVTIGRYEDDLLSKKISVLKDNYTVTYNKLKHFEKSLECDEPLVSSDESHASDFAGNDTLVAVNESKTITCSKCAAQLILNRDKRVYECKSCGVAYGVSLFFGLPHEKALNAMNIGNFGDADQRFSNILMVTPNDFEALLGQVLCKGRWTNISSINFSEYFSPSRIIQIKSCLKDVRRKASDEDKEFFDRLTELISILDEISKNSYRITGCENALNAHEAKVKVYSQAYPNVGEELLHKKTEIMTKLTECRENEKRLNGNFSFMKEKLLNYNKDSILAR